MAARITRTERAALTRNELLRAAERRFLRNGYHDTTLNDIVADAGYTKGAVYSAFKSKAGLFLALCDEVVDRRLNEMRSIGRRSSGDAWVAALAAQLITEHNAQFLVLAVEFLSHARRDPSLADAFAERYGRLRAGLADLAPPNTKLGVEQWAIVTLALSNGLALERLLDPTGVSWDPLAELQAHIRA